MFGYTKTPKDLKELMDLIEKLPFKPSAIILSDEDLSIRGNALNILAAAGAVFTTLYNKGNGDSSVIQFIDKVGKDLGLRRNAKTYSGPIHSTVTSKKKK
jgi:hypothetical protein